MPLQFSTLKHPQHGRLHKYHHCKASAVIHKAFHLDRNGDCPTGNL